MKQTKDYQKAQANMLPGIITANGFLGTDLRPLADIIAADEIMMTHLGLDWLVVVAELRRLQSAGMAGLGEPITVDERWLVRVDETRGQLPSPWEDGIFHKVNCDVTRLEAGSAVARLVYNDLSLHLMEKYHFLQGQGSPFRMEPEAINAVLR